LQLTESPQKKQKVINIFKKPYPELGPTNFIQVSQKKHWQAWWRVLF